MDRIASGHWDEYFLMSLPGRPIGFEDFYPDANNTPPSPGTLGSTFAMTTWGVILQDLGTQSGLFMWLEPISG
jgi:hypothetical protein